jgi:hypothetical protein
VAGGETLALGVPPGKAHLFDTQGRAFPRLAADAQRHAA